jgi:hypothetical protein
VGGWAVEAGAALVAVRGVVVVSSAGEIRLGPGLPVSVAVDRDLKIDNLLIGYAIRIIRSIMIWFMKFCILRRSRNLGFKTKGAKKA